MGSNVYQIILIFSNFTSFYHDQKFNNIPLMLIAIAIEKKKIVNEKRKFIKKKSRHIPNNGKWMPLSSIVVEMCIDSAVAQEFEGKYERKKNNK